MDQRIQSIRAHCSHAWVEPDSLRGDRPLRDEVDLDSMDWLRFLAALHQRLGVNIPEADYQQLTTMNVLLAYLARRLTGG